MIKSPLNAFLLATVLASAACSGQETVKRVPPAAQSSPPMAQLQPQTAHNTARPLAPPVDPNAPLPPGHPAVGQAGSAAAPELPAVPEGAGQGKAALAWTVPAGWISEPPASSMRRAQYQVPGPAGDGECAVFYFG